MVQVAEFVMWSSVLTRASVYRQDEGVPGSFITSD